MARIEIDVSTGERTEIPLTQAEIAAAAAATAAEQNDPRRLRDIADEVAKQSVKLDPVVQYLRDHTPDEAEAYVETNVTNLVTSKAFLKKMARAMCVLAKQNLR